ncbi:hypothetical protein GGX14DRAFT_429378, partial [Mycena pura]
MAGSAILVQEIWDEIVDHLALACRAEAMDMEDLKSASLIGRCFVSRPQSHIFRSISVQNMPRVTARVLAERLLDLMSSSPHLIRYVQALQIHSGDSVTLHSVAQIGWSHVYQLTLGGVEAASGSVVLEKLTILVSLSSLRSLVFRIGHWDAALLCNIFARCTTGVKRFTFVHCNPARLSAPFVPSAVPSTLARPTHIFLSASSSMVDLLLDPTCPVDLSGLTHLRCVEFNNQRFNVLLGRVGATLTHLHVIGRHKGLDDVNPALLPALTQLDVYATAPPFSRFLARLPIENRIATVNVHGNFVIDKDFEGVLLGRPMPVLKRVIVQVLEQPPEFEAWMPSPPSAETVHSFQLRLPRLHERGLLSVEFVPFQGGCLV